MEIKRQHSANVLTLLVDGRLDAYWADHLSAALDDALRSGARRVHIDMAQVSFVSSVGIRVLLRFHKQLQRIDGSLTVVDPSEAVSSVLEMAGLLALLGEAATAESTPATTTVELQRPGGTFQIFPLATDATLRCRLLGDPQPLVRAAYSGNSQHLRCTGGAFGLGLGAFGRDYAECRDRFGEFLFAGGAAAYLPTDGSNVADYVVSTGALLPELEALYAMVCDGQFSNLLRFEANEATGAVSLEELADASLSVAAADTAGFVMIAESAGLIGAALRQSPTGDGAGSLFEHPRVRDWLSFTPERAYPRGVALITGVVSRKSPATLAPLLRPLGAGLEGHVHAAAFTYSPLAAGHIELEPTVAGLCERQQLQSVLHLLNDDRPIVGVGQSIFVRGALWVGAIAEVIQ